MKRKSLIVPLALAGLALGFAAVSHGDGSGGDPETERILQGFKIAPVHLNLRNKNRDLVGLGSYIVNAQGGCIDCHTNPSYAPGTIPSWGSPSRSTPRTTSPVGSSSVPSPRRTSRPTRTACPPA